MERDRSILTLASGGIGLLVTLLVTFGIKTQCQILAYFVAITSFVATIFSALAIFTMNSRYIERLHRKDNTEDKTLAFLDKVLLASFLIGIVGTIAVGLVTVTRNQTGEFDMNKNSDGKCANVMTRSLNNMANMQPGLTPLSVNGLVQMSPTTVATNTPASAPAGSQGASAGQASPAPATNTTSTPPTKEK